MPAISTTSPKNFRYTVFARHMIFGHVCSICNFVRNNVSNSLRARRTSFERKVAPHTAGGLPLLRGSTSCQSSQKSQHQWRKFSVDDFKLNVRCFSMFMQKETSVFEKSLLYQQLPDDPAVSTPKKRSALPTSASASDSPNPAKVKRSYKVAADFTSSDDDET